MHRSVKQAGSWRCNNCSSIISRERYACYDCLALSPELGKHASDMKRCEYALNEPDIRLMSLRGRVFRVRKQEAGINAIYDVPDKALCGQNGAATILQTEMKTNLGERKCSKDLVKYTHFLAIPIGLQKELRGRIEKLSSDISKTLADKTLEKAFHSPVRTHLTLLMLKLSKSQEMRAKYVLDKCVERFRREFDSETIPLAGLNYFGEAVTKACVVYVEIASMELRTKLGDFVTYCRELFNSGEMETNEENEGGYVPHVTIINSKYLRTLSVGQSCVSECASFDATKILDEHRDATLGSFLPLSLDIATLNSGRDKNSYYRCLKSVSV